MQKLLSILGSLSLAASSVTTSCLAQGNWTQMNPTASPPARIFPAMAFDFARQRTVLFGGTGSSGMLNDTWEWDGANWTQMNPTASPPARTIHAMVYDLGRQRTVLFGGNSNGTRMADTWEWDGINWTLMNPANSPPARGGHAMAYSLVRQRTVLLGGTPNGSWNSVLPGVWEWDGINWTQAPTTSAPADRAQHAMAHDWALQRTMVFGGGDSRGAKLNDSWSWDGNGWTQLTPTTSPQARVWHALADDPNRRRTILFGGSTTTNVADTWEWDGVAWVQINTPTTPPARNAHAMAYDSIRRRLVVFGGRAPAYLSDTWEYDGDAALRVDTATISIATGGTQQFTLNAGSWHGSRLFWVFGSLSGTTPGVNLPTSSGSIHIPLNPDVWTDLTISLANTPTLTGTKAALDQQGQALASLNVPVITSPSAIGVTFHHAYLVYDAQGNYYLASNPVSLRLIK